MPKKRTDRQKLDAAGFEAAYVCSHMQAMEGMIASARDRGAIDRKAATASLKYSRNLRSRLKKALGPGS